VTLVGRREKTNTMSGYRKVDDAMQAVPVDCDFLKMRDLKDENRCEMSPSYDSGKCDRCEMN
jgi:hypothetical protein